MFCCFVCFPLVFGFTASSSLFFCFYVGYASCVPPFHWLSYMSLNLRFFLHCFFCSFSSLFPVATYCIWLLLCACCCCCCCCCCCWWRWWWWWLLSWSFLWADSHCACQWCCCPIVAGPTIKKKRVAGAGGGRSASPRNAFHVAHCCRVCLLLLFLLTQAML